MFVHTGDYMKYASDDILHSTYYTFTPRPLMEGEFYAMDEELAALLTETHRTLGILEGLALGASDQEALLNLALLKESCFSWMIDYTDSDIFSLLVTQTSDNSDNVIRNIMSAYWCAADAPKINMDRIGTYAAHGPDSNAKFTARSKPLFLSQSAANYRQYNPTAPENIRSALADMQEYQKSGNIDMLVRAAMCHYQFEMIHPYEYYNGIIGRILNYHILSNTGFKGANLLCLSHALYHHKGEYFNKLGTTQKDGNYLDWITFFICTTKEAAQHSIEAIQKYEELVKHDGAKISQRHRSKAGCLYDVYLYFKKNITSTVGQASQQLGLSFPAVAKSVDNLRESGILRQISSGSRNRIFAYDGILQLISK